MSSVEAGAPDAGSIVKGGSGPWADLGLTLPIFIAYHLGVVFLPVRDAADFLTRELVTLADHSLLAYSGLTLAIGGVYVGTLLVLGRGHTLRWSRFGMVAAEGVLYAVAMRMAAGYVVGRLHLMGGAGLVHDRFTGLVMALGAGFYEEVVFRVILFGFGAKLLKLLIPISVPFKEKLLTVAWGVVAAGVFSAWHYIGPMGDPFQMQSFVFRWVCGIAFVIIYSFRGFAPAVWTHALYDIWVMVL